MGIFMKSKIMGRNRVISLLLGVVVFLSSVVAAPMAMFAEDTVFDYDGYMVNYAITNSWSDNQNVQITVTNTGSEPIYNWSLQYDPCGTILGLWNGEVYANNIVKNAYYNSDIAVGASVSFGYTLLNVTGIPDGFSLCSYRAEKKTGYTVTLNTMSDWGSGFTGLIKIENMTDAPIMAWELSFDANFTITQPGNFAIVENIGGRYRAVGSYNGNVGNISADSSVTLQFNAESVTNPEISNIALTEMVISDTPIVLTDPTDPTDPTPESEYVPWLPEDLDVLVACGFHDSFRDVIILEWAYRDNSGDFSIYEGNSLIADVSDSRTYEISVDRLVPEYTFVVKKTLPSETLLSNEVIMRLNQDGYYEFVIIDSDTDGLPDLYELILGTDPFNPDTDGDGLPDGYEIFVLGTDPLSYDTSGEGSSDGEYDFDEDGLTNYEEYLHGTDPFSSDTDMDGLNDYDEIYVYFTNPLLTDSDSDGLPDDLEIKYGMNPLNPDTLSDGMLDGNRVFTISLEGEMSDNGMVKPFLTIDLQGKQIKSLGIDKVCEDDFFLNPSIPGYLGNAFDFNVDGDFVEAVLTFQFDETLLSDDNFVPAIYCWDEEEQFLFELPNQSIAGNTVSVSLEHFSSYLVIAKNIHDEELFRFEILPPTDDNYQYANIDLALVIDNSGSMSKDSSPKNDRDGLRHILAKDFIDKMGDSDRVCVVNFGTNTTLQTSFTYNKTIAKNAVDTYVDGGQTALYNAVNVANNHFMSNSRTDAKKIMIVLTDGINNVSGSTLVSVTQGAVNNGVTIYTIGLGSQLDLSALNYLAETTGGSYYHAASASLLYDVFDRLKEEMDLVRDTDNDGISDYHEEKIASGELKMGTGAPLNGFESLDFKNPDSDGDGLKDGEEIRVLLQTVSNKDVYYIYMYSNPCMIDSDGDGLLDGSSVTINGKIVAPKDPKPLKQSEPKGIWKNHIEQVKNGNIPTEYASSSADQAFKRRSENTNWAFLESEACMMVYDNMGIALHSQVETWQKLFGFRDLFDDAFRFGTGGLMRKEMFEFSHAGTAYRIWIWRGWYWDLGIGAEIGIYSRENGSLSEKFGQWHSANFNLPMTLHLYNYYEFNNISNVFSWEPKRVQWWITGFNPMYNPMDPKFLVLMGSIKFTDEAMFNSLKDAIDNWDNIELKEYIFLDETEHIAWITWWDV
jgi:hypothetical protein